MKASLFILGCFASLIPLSMNAQQKPPKLEWPDPPDLVCTPTMGIEVSTNAFAEELEATEFRESETKHFHTLYLQSGELWVWHHTWVGDPVGIGSLESIGLYGYRASDFTIWFEPPVSDNWKNARYVLNDSVKTRVVNVRCVPNQTRSGVPSEN